MTDGQFDKKLVNSICFGASSLYKIKGTIDVETGDIKTHQFAAFQLSRYRPKGQEPQTGIIE
jgi:hypothetical protein